MSGPPARWWEMRPARSTKPATYRCPLCGELLPPMVDHVLLKPEGDSSRRRHAHLGCVQLARAAGRLPTEAEWRAAARPSSDDGPRRRWWRHRGP